MNEERTFRKPHNVMLYNRRQLAVSGVVRVDNFNDNVIVLITEAGRLTVEGDNLHINKLLLESGDLDIDGEITAMFYTDSVDADGKKSKRMLSKIFK